MAGVYGDDSQLSEANSELIPLLKRVIALLQENGVTVSPAHYTTVVDSMKNAETNIRHQSK